jgi:hypothetical protein
VQGTVHIQLDGTAPEEPAGKKLCRYGWWVLTGQSMPIPRALTCPWMFPRLQHHLLPRHGLNW